MLSKRRSTNVRASVASLPDGQKAPDSGVLENPNVTRGFSAYIHVPFCAVRCGYCDFNTYTTGFGEGARASDYHDSVMREIALSRKVLDTGCPKQIYNPLHSSYRHDEDRPFYRGGVKELSPHGDVNEINKSFVDTAETIVSQDTHGEKELALLQTVFFGGGTPTMLKVSHLAAILSELKQAFGLAPAAEVTTEANPESVTQKSINELAQAGFTRISYGMQSAVEHVLHTLDRQHTPGQVNKGVEWAKSAGMQVSVDLIYGAPGESMDDWRRSLEIALQLEPDHISAYALTVEKGTKMGAQAARGHIKLQDEDFLAEKYELADEIFSQAGYRWYEISNWARPGKECRHNAVYWGNGNWWGYGPGAHSHINGTRFWNVKHPRAYADRLSSGLSPAAAREVLSEEERREENVMLGIRMREGIEIPSATNAGIIARLIGDELVDPQLALRGRLVLTRKGRLLADTVTRELWGI